MENDSWLVVVDLEGIIGVTNLEDIEKNRTLLRKELLVVLEEIKRLSKGNIKICDIHDSGNNVLLEDGLCDNVQICRGIKEFVNADFSSFSYAILVGFHSKEGGEGMFPHSFKEEISKIQLGDKIVGEVGVFCRWLQGKGITPILISGEGYFADEIENAKSIHQTSLDISESMRNLKKQLQMNLKQRKPSFVKKSIDMVQISMKNPDLLRYLENDYNILDKKIVFESIDKFVEGLPLFCRLVNEATCHVVMDNIGFLKDHKELIKKNSNSTSGGKFVKRDIRFVTRKELFEYLDGVGVMDEKR